MDKSLCTVARATGILSKYVTKPNLVKHMVAVSEAMRHFARIEGEDEEYWATVGLLHDIDYELYPDMHTNETTVKILTDEGYDKDFIHAVQSHGFEICNDICPICYMEEVLSVVDQLSGFIIACALMKPNKKLEEVDLPSIQKKWKDRKFAAGTERDRIMLCCERMGKDFDYMAGETLKALQNVAGKLGL